MVEVDKSLTDYLKKVSPGSPLRIVIDDLMSSNMGALIVFDSPELTPLIEGGFKLNAKFTPNKLFELCKMDGAVVVSPDLKRIVYANVLLTPDSKIHTNETGTRHKAGERTAKQTNTFVIVVSERKNKTTLYLSNVKYFLKDTESLLSEVTSNLHLLETQKEIFNELKINFDILEVSDLVSVRDVCRILQRAETILRISDMIKRYFTELGNVGSVINIRYKELIRGVEKIEDNLLRDYSVLSLKKSKAFLNEFNFDTLMDLETMAKILIKKPLDETISPRGYRFMCRLNMPESDVSKVVKRFGTLDKIFAAGAERFNSILKDSRGKKIKEEINHQRDQVLSGKFSD